MKNPTIRTLLTEWRKLTEAGIDPGVDYGNNPSSPAQKDQAKEALVRVALRFIYGGENATGAALYDELFKQNSGMEDEELSDGLDALATEYGEN